MKAMNIVRASTVLAGLGLTAFLAAPCQAQQETVPDIYDTEGIVQIAPQPQRVPPRQQGAADFQGNFTLPYELDCAGKVLARGDYFLSVNSVGPNRLITVRGKDGIMRIRARMASELTTAGQSMLLVLRSGELRALKAIYVGKLGLLLYLEPDAKQHLARNPDRTERVPISAPAERASR